MGALDLSWVAPSSSLLRSMLVDPLKCVIITSCYKHLISLTCEPARWGVCCLSAAHQCRRGCRCRWAWTRSRPEFLCQRPCLSGAGPCRWGRWHLGSGPANGHKIIVTFYTPIRLAARLGQLPVTQPGLHSWPCHPWNLRMQGVNLPECSWSALSSQTLHHPGNLSSQTSLQLTKASAHFHSRWKQTSEQLPKVVIVRGLEEVESPDIPEVGRQLLRVTLAQNLDGGGALCVTDFLVSLLQ